MIGAKIIILLQLRLIAATFLFSKRVDKQQIVYNYELN